MKRTPQLTFEYDPSVERGVHMTKLIDELAPETPSDDATRSRRRRLTSTRWSTRSARTTASSSSRTRTRTATRSARCSARRSGCARSARTPSCTSPGDAPLPAEYGFMPLGEVLREPPGRRRRARPARARLRERAADRARAGRDRAGGARRRRRPSSRQHPLRRRQPRSSPMRPRPQRSSATCSARSTSRSPPRSPRRSTSGSSPTPAASSTRTRRPKALRLAADLVEAGADVHGVFKRVYETVQFAKLKLLARALEHARVYEGGRVVVSYLLAVGLHGGRGGGAVLRGDHRLPAPERGRAARRPDPRAARGPRRPGAPHLAPLEQRRGRRLRDRASLGWRRPRAGGRLLERRLDRGDRRLHPPRVRRGDGGLMVPRAATPVGIVLVDKPAGPSSLRARRGAPPADRREDRAHGHARPVRDRPAGSVVRICN